MQDLKVYNFLEKLFGMVGNIKIHPVDFNLPWYSIYKRYWLRLAVSLIAEIIVWVFFTERGFLVLTGVPSTNIPTDAHFMVISVVLPMLAA